MGKKCLIMVFCVLAGLFCLVIEADAITIFELDGTGAESLLPITCTWTAYSGSPAGGTTVADISGGAGTNWEVSVGVSNPVGGTQPIGIYGAGTILSGAHGYKVYFDFDGYTWDSYNTTFPISLDADDGYWDLFAVNINQDGYYWSLVNGGTGTFSDPLVSPDPAGTPVIDSSILPGITWGWGGLEMLGGVYEEEHSSWVLTLIGDPAKAYYISAVLDTATTIDVDTGYPSWGVFNSEGEIERPDGGLSRDTIPEPGTMILLSSLATGLFGVSAVRRKHK